MAPVSVPLSVLDLSTVGQGETTSTALAATTELAVSADRSGYRRFWVAEHHSLNTVASTVPAVLMAHLGANTERIRLGSGGVMLPNHAPLSIAEQFAMLEALHPGRIDLGVGRAPGTDQATAAALRRGKVEVEEQFPRDLIDVMGLLGRVRTEHGLWEQFSATPAAQSSPEVFLLGSSMFSAQLAGLLGLPYVFANHFDMGGTTSAVQTYRERFEPSPDLDTPMVMVTASVIVAASDADAQRLSAPSRLYRLGLRSGQRIPLLAPDDALAHPSYATAESMPTGALYGTIDTVAAGLEQLVGTTGADEIMIHIPAYDLADRVATASALAPEPAT